MTVKITLRKLVKPDGYSDASQFNNNVESEWSTYEIFYVAYQNYSGVQFILINGILLANTSGVLWSWMMMMNTYASLHDFTNFSYVLCEVLNDVSYCVIALNVQKWLAHSFTSFESSNICVNPKVLCTVV